MRDGNRIKEKFRLELDGRHIASVVVGAIVMLGGTFVLGLSVGKQLAREAAKARDAAAPADPLAALDAPPVPPDPHAEPPRLDFHEQLTQAKSPSAPVAVVAKAAAPRAAVPAVPAAPKPAAAVPKPAAPPPPEAASDDEEASAAPAPKDGADAAGWAIQVGAAQDVAEANKIADRFHGQKARVVAADIPGKGRWYRVRVGSFDSRDAADRFLKDLVRETGARAFVTATR